MPKKRRSSKSSHDQPVSEAAAIDEFFALESAPPASVMDELELRGGTFPPPDELTDTALPAMLWRMLRSLACMGTFIRNTDHLTDRQLYVRLWRDTLREESHIPTPRGMNGGFFLSMVPDEDYDTYARYYMSPGMRRMEEERGEKLPPKKRPPFKRDRHLPKCGRPFDEGPAFDPEKWRPPKVGDYVR